MANVDNSSPEAIRAAFQHVQRIPVVRSNRGPAAMWAVFNNNARHEMERAELEKRFGANDLHFGWLCKQVSKALGDQNPDRLSLAHVFIDDKGREILKLKAPVVAAMQIKSRRLG